MKNIAVLFAGGIGSRMGANIPKQFLEIYGKPILVHTIEKFQYCDEIDEIYIGSVKKYIPHVEKMVEKYNLTKVKKANIIQGGKSGLETIYKLINKVYEDYPESNVLIHDGVRPNITEEVIRKNVKTLINKGNSITCVPLFETPIVSSNGNNIDKILPRSEIYVAKAPQCFKTKDILEAYQKLYNDFNSFEVDGIVDSCSIAKYCGIDLNIVIGNRDNIKVTTPNDYIEILSKLVANDYEGYLNINDKNEG